MLEIELFNLLEGTSDAAFAVTDQGEICSWNKAAEKLFGYTAKEAINKTCGSVLQGLGPLGNEMCGENCSICHRAEKRSEERRVGKECRSRWSRDHKKKTRKREDRQCGC